VPAFNIYLSFFFFKQKTGCRGGSLLQHRNLIILEIKRVQKRGELKPKPLAKRVKQETQNKKKQKKSIRNNNTPTG